MWWLCVYGECSWAMTDESVGTAVRDHLYCFDSWPLMPWGWVGLAMRSTRVVSTMWSFSVRFVMHSNENQLLLPWNLTNLIMKCNHFWCENRSLPSLESYHLQTNNPRQKPSHHMPINTHQQTLTNPECTILLITRVLLLSVRPRQVAIANHMGNSIAHGDEEEHLQWSRERSPTKKYATRMGQNTGILKIGTNVIKKQRTMAWMLSFLNGERTTTNQTRTWIREHGE